MAEGTRMLQRRATEAVWTTSAYVLAPGELGVTTDTGIIKIGNGTSPWSELDIAFDSQFLPILGKAADSELLDGIGSESFVKVADTSVNATNDSYVKRTADGGVKGTDATEATELVTLQQLQTDRYHLVSRSVSASTTLLAADAFTQVNVYNNTRDSTLTYTIPTDASVPLPIGAWVDICSTGIGATVIALAGGVAFYGDTRIYGNMGSIRIVKTSANNWELTRRSDPSDAYAICFMYQTANSPGMSSGWRDLPLNAETIDTHNGHLTNAVVSGNDTDSNPAYRTNRYTCKPAQAGTYRVSGLFYVGGLGGGNDVQCRVLKNGAVSAISGGQNMPANASYVNTGDKLFELAEGDYLSMQGYINGTNWIAGGSTGGNTSTLSVVRVS